MELKNKKLSAAALASVVTLLGSTSPAMALTYSEYIAWHNENDLASQAHLLSSCESYYSGSKTNMTDSEYTANNASGQSWATCLSNSETHSPSHVAAHSRSADDAASVRALSTSVSKTTQLISTRVASIIRPSSSNRSKMSASATGATEGVKNVLSSVAKPSDSSPVGLSYSSSAVGVHAGDALNGFSLTAGKDFGTVGLSAGDQLDNGIGLWVNVSYINTNDKHLATLSDGEMWMVIAGVDKQVREDAAVGIAFTYERNDEDTNLSNAGIGKVESTAYTIAPYAVATLTDSVTADASIGVSFVDNYRRSSGGVTSNFDSTRYFMAANLNGYASVGAFDLSSSMGWLNSWEDQDAYTSSDASTSIKKKNKLVQVSLSGEASYPRENVEPYVSLRLEKDLVWTDIIGVTHDAFGATVGGGMRFTMGSIIGELNAETDIARNQLEQYSFMGNLRYEF